MANSIPIRHHPSKSLRITETTSILREAITEKHVAERLLDNIIGTVRVTREWNRVEFTAGIADISPGHERVGQAWLGIREAGRGVDALLAESLAVDCCGGIELCDHVREDYG